MRLRWRWALILMAPMMFTTGLTAGCGGAVPDEELGEIIYEVPNLPEAQKPLEMPLLEPPKNASVVGPAAPSNE
ncbi:MAG: hypothetical protein IIA67_13170 [Planctomycetes bacterium]|nr:hypothetical protein [Planctomycetota bacterium]